jgi:hypothetical protein
MPAIGRSRSKSAMGHSRRFWHVVGMSGFGVISERPVLRVEGIGLGVIQTPKAEPRIMRYELTDLEWAAI